MEHFLELSSDGNAHNLICCLEENNQKVLQEGAMDGALQSNVSCSMGDFVGGPPSPMPSDLSVESNEGGRKFYQHEELLGDKKAVQVHEMGGKIVLDNLTVDHQSSNHDSAHGMTLTECNTLSCKLVGDNSANNIGTANTCHQEKDLVEQPTLSLETCSTEVFDGEKVDDQVACISSSENSITCCKAELGENIDECVISDLTVESHNSCSEVRKLEEDEESKASAEDPVSNVPEEDLGEVQSVDKKDFSLTGSSNTYPNDVGCDEGNGAHICNSGSLTHFIESKEIQEQDVKHMVAGEATGCEAHGMHFEPYKEIEKEGNVGSTDCAQYEDAASAAIADGSQVAGASLEKLVTQNVTDSSIYLIQCDLKSTAEAGESTEPLTRDSCNASNEVTLEQKCSTGVDEDTNKEDHVASTNVVSCVELSKVGLGENIEEDGASYGDEGRISAAAETCLSASSSIISTLSQVRNTEKDALIAQCRPVDGKGRPPSQTEDGAGSSECQHRGSTVDKDGGSSIDSTAGTGQQRSDGCVPAEDEEASSTGGEDTASSPVCIQPLTQQRKKINIHHQFVREIVKIQHDREQSREQAERQIPAQQAASLPQVGYKTTDIKEQKSTLSEVRDIRGETNKQKGLKDPGDHSRQGKDAQQKHSTRNKKPSLIQSRNGSSHQWISPQESNEQSRQACSQAVGAKEHGKIGRGKQQRSMSIYHPPVVRESLAAEQRNLGEPDTFYHQSGAYAMNSSPDSSASSFSEYRIPIAGSPHFSNEGPLNVVRSSSGESYADNIELQAESSTPGMGIKVTFDTEKRQRHIQFSDGPESLSRVEQVSPAASHNSRLSKGPMNPSFGHPFQDSKFSSGSRQIDHGEGLSKGNPSFSHSFQDSKFSSGSRQIELGETPSKGNDRFSTQAGRSGSSHSYSSSEPSHYRGRAGKSSDKMTEKKNNFFEQADNSADLHNSSSWLHKSPPSLIRHGSDGRSGRNTFGDSTRHPEWYAGTPSPASQGFSTPRSQRTASWGPSHEAEFFGSTTFASHVRNEGSNRPMMSMQAATTNVRNEGSNRPAMNMQANFQHQQFNEGSNRRAMNMQAATTNVRNEGSNRPAMNMQANFQHQQFNTPRSHEFRGNQRYAISTDNSRGKKEQKNSVKDFASPFQAMMKDISRPQAVFSSPAQRSADANLDSKGYGMSWHAKDQTQTRGQDTSQESLRRSQSDDSRKNYTQNLQDQSTSSPSRQSLFPTMPMQEKWGDIVDDLTDSYDYLQIKTEGEEGTHLGSLSYGASNNQSTAGFIDSKASKPVFRDPKQDRGMPKYSYKETDSLQKHTDLAREQSAYETPGRKSVFERLGPQNNFQESILGPPPKVLDNRGVLKASPDALISNAPPVSTYKSFDSGYYGSQWASSLPSVQHDNADTIIDEGREVVVQAYTEVKQRRSKRELYVPRRGS